MPMRNIFMNEIFPDLVKGGEFCSLYVLLVLYVVGPLLVMEFIALTIVVSIIIMESHH